MIINFLYNFLVFFYTYFSMKGKVIVFLHRISMKSKLFCSSIKKTCLKRQTLTNRKLGMLSALRRQWNNFTLTCRSWNFSVNLFMRLWTLDWAGFCAKKHSMRIRAESAKLIGHVRLYRFLTIIAVDGQMICRKKKKDRSKSLRCWRKKMREEPAGDWNSFRSGASHEVIENLQVCAWRKPFVSAVPASKRTNKLKNLCQRFSDITEFRWKQNISPVWYDSFQISWTLVVLKMCRCFRT